MGRGLVVAALIACAVAPFGPAAWAGSPQAVGKAGAAELINVELAGGAVVWSRSTGRYAAPAEIVSAEPGGPERVLLRPPLTAGTGVEQLPTVAAARGRVLVGVNDFARSESTVEVVGSSMWAGSPHSMLTRQPLLRPSEFVLQAGLTDAASALLLAGRTGGRQRLLVQQGPRDRWRERPISRHTFNLAVAGHFIATGAQRGDQDRTRVTVRDVRSWRRVTSVVVPEDSGDIVVALQRSGTMGVAYGLSRQRIALVPRGSRRLRLLSARPASLDVGFGRGLIFTRRMRGGGRALIERLPGGRYRRLTPRLRGLVAFDVQGPRLAFRTRSCVYFAIAPARGSLPIC